MDLVMVVEAISLVLVPFMVGVVASVCAIEDRLAALDARGVSWGAPEREARR